MRLVVVAALLLAASCTPDHPEALTFRGERFTKGAEVGERLGVRMTAYTPGGVPPTQSETAIGFITMGLTPERAVTKTAEWLRLHVPKTLLIQNEGDNSCRVYLDLGEQPVLSHVVLRECGYNKVCGLDHTRELDQAPDPGEARRLCESGAPFYQDLEVALEKLL